MNLVFVNHEVFWVSWMYGADEHVPRLRHTNQVIGAYVTAVAMIHLYHYFDRLRENAIYCDKESVIYIQPRDEYELIETRDKNWKT